MQVVAALLVSLGAIFLAAPAFARLNVVGEQRPAESLLAVLAGARQSAIAHHVAVTLVLDPVTGRFHADSVGASGKGVLLDSTLALPSARSLSADTPRPTFHFDASGSADADSVLVRDGEATLMVVVDPRSGVPHVSER